LLDNPSLQHKVGVITVTYNSGKVIDEFLGSLVAQTHQNFVLYAIDNASQDDTLERLNSFTDPRTVVIANHQNLGCAAGNNLGIHAALESGCDSVLLINNDTVFEPQLIEKLVAGLSQYACQMTAPKMLYYDCPTMIWAAGGCIPWSRGLRPKHFGYRQGDRGQFDKPRRVNYVPTCCTLISSDVFRLIGYFDTRYFVYFDDVDFMYRAMQADVKLFYLPGATLLHRIQALTGKNSEFVIRYANKNYLYFLLKNFGFWGTLPFFIANQAYFAARLLLTLDTPGVYLLKQASFREALQDYQRS